MKEHKEYSERYYRKRARARDLVSFRVVVKETDLWISAEDSLEKEAEDLVFSYRNQLENYISAHPEFLTTYHPFPEDPFAPPMVKEMIEYTRRIEVGPMASVAGAIAQYVGMDLLRLTGQVIVENGGDIFLSVKRPATISIFAGKSPLSEKIGIKAPATKMPLGICSSSATIGHSFSAGKADLACVVSQSAILADGAATALCNRVQSKKDLRALASWAKAMKGVLGALLIMGDQLATWGDIELIRL